MTLTSSGSTTWTWWFRQGQRTVLDIPVLDDDNDPATVAGWTVDAQIKTRPGGDTLYTWPADLAQVADGGTTVTLTTPRPVSELWTWRIAWYRVVITDPASDVDDPDTQRVLQGRFVLDPD